jgi:hypothetical protein
MKRCFVLFWILCVACGTELSDPGPEGFRREKVRLDRAAFDAELMNHVLSIRVR